MRVRRTAVLSVELIKNETDLPSGSGRRPKLIPPGMSFVHMIESSLQAAPERRTNPSTLTTIGKNNGELAPGIPYCAQTFQSMALRPRGKRFRPWRFAVKKPSCRYNASFPTARQDLLSPDDVGRTWSITPPGDPIPGKEEGSSYYTFARTPGPTPGWGIGPQGALAAHCCRTDFATGTTRWPA